MMKIINLKVSLQQKANKRLMIQINNDFDDEL